MRIKWKSEIKNETEIGREQEAKRHTFIWTKVIDVEHVIPELDFDGIQGDLLLTIKKCLGRLRGMMSLTPLTYQLKKS